MDASKAGDWQIIVSEPYPAWCELRHMGQTLVRFHHNELADLQYAVERAMQIAALKLKDRSEVYPK